MAPAGRDRAAPASKGKAAPAGRGKMAPAGRDKAALVGRDKAALVVKVPAARTVRSHHHLNNKYSPGKAEGSVHPALLFACGAWHFHPHFERAILLAP